MRRLSWREYEEFVATLLEQLDFCDGATVRRNRRFPGIRQPGKYEIDISVKAQLAGVIDFHLIVECKNWKKSVGRPEVQKLVQTRDAIGAHKAAIASPVGFSDEAVDVAEANGIALWVISQVGWNVVRPLASDPGAYLREIDRCERELLKLRYHGIDVSSSCERALDRPGIWLADATVGAPTETSNRGWLQFSHNLESGHPGRLSCGIRGLDPTFAVTGLANAFLAYRRAHMSRQQEADDVVGYLQLQAREKLMASLR